MTEITEGPTLSVVIPFFDEGENVFTAQGGAEVALSSRHAISGRSVRVRRKSPGGYFGGIRQFCRIENCRVAKN